MIKLIFVGAAIFLIYRVMSPPKQKQIEQQDQSSDDFVDYEELD